MKFVRDLKRAHQPLVEQLMAGKRSVTSSPRKPDPAACRLQSAGDQIEQRRLAGPIGTNQTR